MSVLSSPTFLRNVLLADAASCLACGGLQVVFNTSMSTLLALAPALLMGSGIFLLAYAALVGWIATRDPVPRSWVWLLVAGNLGWAVACAAVLLGGVVTPTGLGKVYLVAQALTVLVLAELQWFGLRRAGGGLSAA